MKIKAEESVCINLDANAQGLAINLLDRFLRGWILTLNQVFNYIIAPKYSKLKIKVVFYPFTLHALPTVIRRLPNLSIPRQV